MTAPLVIGEPELDRALDVVEEAIADETQGKRCGPVTAAGGWPRLASSRAASRTHAGPGALAGPAVEVGSKGV
jgi:hypothetical protein